MILSDFLLEFGDVSLQHSNASEPALNFISRFFCPGVLDDQILAIPFQSSPDGQALEDAFHHSEDLILAASSLRIAWRPYAFGG
jgi:hypothetical protein